MRRKLSVPQEIQLCKDYLQLQPDGTYNGAKTICKKYGCCANYVYYILVAYNIRIRSSKEARIGGKSCKPIKNIPQPGSIPPLCKCGCGEGVIWNQRKNGWNVFVIGHYRKNLPYKDRGWLYREYCINHRTLQSIGNEFGVNLTVINKFMKKFGIPTRKQSESLTLSGAVRGSKNPAWKGGIAKWDYSYDWKAVCKNVKDRDKWTCQSCGETRKRWGNYLHVHHIDGDKFNNSPPNLISLCAKCHHQAHSKNGI